MKFLTVLCLCSVLYITVVSAGKKKKNRFKSGISNIIVIPEQEPTTTTTTTTTKKPVVVKPEEGPEEIPEKQRSAYVPTELLEKLRSINSIEDFLNTFKPAGLSKKGDGSDVLKFITSDVGGKTEERVLADLDPENIKCTPRPKLIQIPIDYSSVYYPACVTLDQCGGCCPNSLTQECVPSKVENKLTTVFKIPFSNGIPIPHDVNLLHHTECSCECRVKAEHCSEYQTYDQRNCQCQCDRKPLNCGPIKVWSSEACNCVCRASIMSAPCPEKKVRDPATCGCKCKKDQKHCEAKGRELDPSTCRCVSYGK